MMRSDGEWLGAEALVLGDDTFEVWKMPFCGDASLSRKAAEALHNLREGKSEKHRMSLYQHSHLPHTGGVVTLIEMRNVIF